MREINPRTSIRQKGCYYALTEFLDGIPVESIPKLLGDIVASAVADIPDEDWRKVLQQAAVPCGKHGCRCHIISTQLIEACDTLRDVIIADLKREPVSPPDFRIVLPSNLGEEKEG